MTAARVRPLPSIKHNAVELFMTVDLRAVSETCHVYQCHMAHTVIKSKCKVQSSCIERETDRVALMQRCRHLLLLNGGNEPGRVQGREQLIERADNVTMKAAMQTYLVSNIPHISQLLKMLSLKTLIELFVGCFIWAN